MFPHLELGAHPVDVTVLSVHFCLDIVSLKCLVYCMRKVAFFW